MSDRPTDDGKPESWQGSSPNGSNAGAGVAYAPLAPSLPQTVRLLVTDTDTESRANFAQNQGKGKGTMGKQRRTQEAHRKRISKGGKE